MVVALVCLTHMDALGGGKQGVGPSISKSELCCINKNISMIYGLFKISLSLFLPPSLFYLSTYLSVYLPICNVYLIINMHSRERMLPVVSDCSNTDHFPLRGWVPPDGTM